MTEKPARILVINVTRIGDTIRITPALYALAEHWPNAAIDVLAHPGRYCVLENLPYLRTVGPIEKRGAVFKGYGCFLLGKQYDLAFVYGHDKSLIEYALRVSAKVVAFRQKNERINQRLFKAVVEPEQYSIHQIDAVLRLVEAVGVRASTKRLHYQVTDNEKQEAQSVLNAIGVDLKTPLIGFQIASFATKSFRDWPEDHFFELAQRIQTASPLAQIILFGGPDDFVRRQKLQHRIGAAAFVLPAVPLRISAAAMSLLKLYIGVDTGPTHIMSAFDIPMVGMYHCYLPHEGHGPLDNPYDHCVTSPVDEQGHCDQNTPMCLLSVDKVWAQISPFLGRFTP